MDRLTAFLTPFELPHADKDAVAFVASIPVEPAEAEGTETGLQVPGLIRRVRRILDLSQRDLAGLLEVDHSLVARWETGRREPRLAVLEKLLQLAGLRLQVRDGADQEPRVMCGTPVRDRQGRRYPAHLDVFGFSGYPTRPQPRGWAGQRCAPRRYQRDQYRHAKGEPPAGDHPTESQLGQALHAAWLARDRRLELRREQCEAALAARGITRPVLEPCTCPDACFETAGCVDTCTCRCEDPESDPTAATYWCGHSGFGPGT